MKLQTLFIIIILSQLTLISCTKKSAELGTKENPIKIALVPGQDTKLLEDRGNIIAKYLTGKIGLEFKIFVPVSYVAVIEAMGSQRADIAMINSFGYLIAHEKYGAEARLIGVNSGKKTYKGLIVAHKNGKVKSVKDINGRTFAFVDPSSTSGYVLASQLLKVNNIQPKETVFAGRHDSVVTMVYQRQVDAGAIFYSPDSEEGKPQDARVLVETQFPDVLKQVMIIGETQEIPNDPVAFRKDFPADLRESIAQELKNYIRTPDGNKVFYEMYHAKDFADTKDEEYNVLREIVQNLHLDVSKLLKKK